MPIIGGYRGHCSYVVTGRRIGIINLITPPYCRVSAVPVPAIHMSSSSTSLVEGRRGSAASEQSTPQPNRAHAGMTSNPPSRTVAAHASNASLATAQGSPSGHRTLSSEVVTVDSALAVANGSHQIALENLVSERNSIRNQNVLLWRHLEKAKSTAGVLKKDLDRIRAERDRLMSMLETLKDERFQIHPSRRGSGDDVSDAQHSAGGPGTRGRHQSGTGRSRSVSAS